MTISMDEGKAFLKLFYLLQNIGAKVNKNKLYQSYKEDLPKKSTLS